MNEAVEIIRRCQNSGITITLNGDNLKVSAPSKVPQEMKDALREYKAAIIRLLTKPASFKLSDFLNGLIARGVTFDVATDDFEICDADKCTAAEKEYLDRNRTFILCRLQYGLLSKHLFSSSPASFSEFQFEMEERKALADGTSTDRQIECDVTKKWYANLLEIKEEK